jgi:hypothetical protein
LALFSTLGRTLPKLAPAALAASVPLASADAERSFSVYNCILADNRQSLTGEYICADDVEI